MDDRPTITKVELRRVEIRRPKAEPFVSRETEPLAEGQYWRSDMQDLTTWERLRHYGKLGNMTIGLMPKIFNILKGIAMKDYKTTVSGVVGALALLVTTFTGFEVSPAIQSGIIALTLAAIGYFAGDYKKG